MGSLLISTLGTLSPKAYYLFIIIAAVGFFGVYVPWNEKKKRTGSQPSASQPKKPERRPAPRQKPAPPPRPAPPGPKERDRLDQLDSLLDAGILTPEEYRERRSRILEGKR